MYGRARVEDAGNYSESFVRDAGDAYVAVAASDRACFGVAAGQGVKYGGPAGGLQADCLAIGNLPVRGSVVIQVARPTFQRDRLFRLVFAFGVPGVEGVPARFARRKDDE